MISTHFGPRRKMTAGTMVALFAGAMNTLYRPSSSGHALLTHLSAVLLVATVGMTGLQALGRNMRSTIGSTTAARAMPDRSAKTLTIAHVPPALGSHQAGVHSPTRVLSRLAEQLTSIDISRAVVEGAQRFNALPQHVRRATLEDWHGFLLYDAYQPGKHVHDSTAMAQAIAGDPDTFSKLSELGSGRLFSPSTGTVSRLSGLGTFLEKLADAGIIDALANPRSEARMLVRIHGAQQTRDLPYELVLATREQLRTYLSSTAPTKSAMLDPIPVVRELDPQLAHHAARQIAEANTSPKWVENHVNLLREQAVVASERRFIHHTQRDTVRPSNYVSNWLPDQHSRPNQVGPFPWRETHLTYSVNRELPFRLAYGGDSLVRALNAWERIPVDSLARPAFRELIEPALVMFEDNARLQRDELTALAVQWGNAPLLPADDLFARIRTLDDAVSKTMAMRDKNAVSKVEYLHFVDEYIENVSGATTVTPYARDGEKIFSAGGSAAATGAMPLPSQGIGYWSFNEAYDWFSRAIDRKSGRIKPPTLPVEIPLGARGYDGNFGDAFAFARHDVVHVTGAWKRLNAETMHERVLFLFAKVDEAERALLTLPRESPRFQALRSWVNEARSTVAEAIWEGRRLDNDLLPATPGT